MLLSETQSSALVQMKSQTAIILFLIPNLLLLAHKEPLLSKILQGFAWFMIVLISLAIH